MPVSEVSGEPGLTGTPANSAKLISEPVNDASDAELAPILKGQGISSALKVSGTPGTEAQMDQSTEEAGTTGAETLSPMIAAQEMPQTAHAQEQDLPGFDGDSGEREQNLPSPTAGSDILDGQQQATLFRSPTLQVEVEQAAAAEAASSTHDVVARTQELISNVAVRIQQGDVSGVSVVIKPESGTELSLELRLRNGAVEAQAQLSSGNIVELQREWPELQERLARQGIQLGELQYSGSQGSGNSSNENSWSERRGHEAANDGFEPQQHRKDRGTLPTQLQTSKRHAGWESWA